MKIVAVSPHLPYEGVPHAGGHFLLHHLGALGANHDVRVFVPANDGVLGAVHQVPTWLAVTVTPSATSPVVATARDHLSRRIRFRALDGAAVRGLWGSGLAEAAADADVVELHWIDAAVLAKPLRRRGVDALISVVAYDVTAHARPAMRSLLRQQTPQSWVLDRIRTKVEARDLDAADLVLVFKEQDREILTSIGVRADSLVVEPSLDVPTTAPVARRPGTVLFTGAMGRQENGHGATWLLRNVWPRVVDVVPDARLVIAGDSPPESLLRLASTVQGVEVTGRVPDLSPFYAGAEVFVAPLFAPGGIKFKVAQALMFDLPVVATPIAIEGHDAPEGVLWAVTDDPCRMAEALIDALRHPHAAADVGRAAGQWARQRFSFDRSVAAVVARYERILSQRVERTG